MGYAAAARIENDKHVVRVDHHPAHVLILSGATARPPNQAGKAAARIVAADLPIVGVVKVEPPITGRSRVEDSPKGIFLGPVHLANREFFNQPDLRSPRRRAVGAAPNCILRLNRTAQTKENGT